MAWSWKKQYNLEFYYYKISLGLCHSLPNLKSYKGVGIVFITYAILVISAIVLWDCLIIFIMPKHKLKILKIIVVASINISSITCVVFFRRRKYLSIYFTLRYLEEMLYGQFGQITKYEDKTLICITSLFGVCLTIDVIRCANDNIFYSLLLPQKFMLYLSLFQIFYIFWIATVLNKNLTKKYYEHTHYLRAKMHYNKIAIFLQGFEDICNIMENVYTVFKETVYLVYMFVAIQSVASVNFIHKTVTERASAFEILLVAASILVVTIITGTLAVCSHMVKNNLHYMAVVNENIWLSYPIRSSNSFEVQILLNMVELFGSHIRKRKLQM